MTFYIHVHSGLSNKLIPLLSLLRIGRIEKKNIECYWGAGGYSNHNYQFLDLFKEIKNVKFINELKFKKKFKSNNYKIYNITGSDKNKKEAIYNSSNESAIFYKIVHLISYKNDNIKNKYIPYPREKIFQNNLIKELRLIIKELKPIDKILEKVQNVTKLFENKKVVGLHCRCSEVAYNDKIKISKNPWDKINFSQIYNLIEKYINMNYKIYLSCDNSENETILLNKYKNNIIIFNNPFGNTYKDKFNRLSFGQINAVCELFILSKCTVFFGTPSSSFSFMVWLLRNDNELNFWCDDPWK
jgi:hypothetical protein